MDLSARLLKIGIQIEDSESADEIGEVDIEHTILLAIASLPDQKDPQRILHVLISWINIHGWSLIGPKMKRILNAYLKKGADLRFASLLASFALAKGLTQKKMWNDMLKLRPEDDDPIRELFSTERLVKMRGYAEWSKDSGYFIASGVLEAESKHVLSRKKLAKISTQYRNRLIVGAIPRADMLTAQQLGARTPTEISRLAEVSYEPAHSAYRDFLDAGLISLRKSYDQN